MAAAARSSSEETRSPAGDRARSRWRPFGRPFVVGAGLGLSFSGFVTLIGFFAMTSVLR